MEKYAKAQMEVIEFENEDVITASGTCTSEGYEDCVGFGTNDPRYPGQGLCSPAAGRPFQRYSLCPTKAP